ncbi:hypothetical protein FRAHR75_380002 [Frankia sp. Hr75.2]|nr:hypothetical protein FRAHR75_380002 [Frankia sp. Hr75.2]
MVAAPAARRDRRRDHPRRGRARRAPGPVLHPAARRGGDRPPALITTRTDNTTGTDATGTGPQWHRPPLALDSPGPISGADIGAADADGAPALTELTP